MLHCCWKFCVLFVPKNKKTPVFGTNKTWISAVSAHDQIKRKSSICWLFATFFLYDLLYPSSTRILLAHHCKHFHFRLFLHVIMCHHSFFFSFFLFLSLNLDSNDWFFVWYQTKSGYYQLRTSLPWMSLSYIFLYAKYKKIPGFLFLKNSLFLIPNAKKHFDGRNNFIT